MQQSIAVYQQGFWPCFNDRFSKWSTQNPLSLCHHYQNPSAVSSIDRIIVSSHWFLYENLIWPFVKRSEGTLFFITVFAFVQGFVSLLLDVMMLSRANAVENGRLFPPSGTVRYCDKILMVKSEHAQFSPFGLVNEHSFIWFIICLFEYRLTQKALAGPTITLTLKQVSFCVVCLTIFSYGCFQVTTYDLVSVICHHGGYGGGHYVCYALNWHNQRWYEYDDDIVTEKDPEQIAQLTSEAYILFYRWVTVWLLQFVDNSNGCFSFRISCHPVCFSATKEYSHASINPFCSLRNLRKQDTILSSVRNQAELLVREHMVSLNYSCSQYLPLTTGTVWLTALCHCP